MPDATGGDSAATPVPDALAHWEAVDLVDQSAAIALAHASELRTRLNAMTDATVPGIAAAREQAHRLIVDIASLRNAAELLKRELGS